MVLFLAGLDVRAADRPLPGDPEYPPPSASVWRALFGQAEGDAVDVVRFGVGSFTQMDNRLGVSQGFELSATVLPIPWLGVRLSGMADVQLGGTIFRPVGPSSLWRGGGAAEVRFGYPSRSWFGIGASWTEHDGVRFGGSLGWSFLLGRRTRLGTVSFLGGQYLGAGAEVGWVAIGR
jgi:hypothetical protein